MKKLSVLLLLVTLALTLPMNTFAGKTLERVKTKGVLKVATAPNWPPQSFLNDNNEIDGFNADVAKEIGKRLGVKVTFVTPEWNIITSGRWNGRWDLSVGSMTPTKKRAEILNFPAVYQYGIAAFAVHKSSSVRHMEELNGKKIGVSSGSTADNYLEKTLTIDAVGAPPINFVVTAGEIKKYGNSSIALDDLRLGDGIRLDAVLDDRSAMLEAIKNGYPLKIVDGVAFAEPLAIATDKGDKDFDSELVEIVKKMKTDGTLKRLSNKWYGADTTVGH